MNFEVVYYERPNGTIPVDEFLGTLPNKLQAKALHDIRLIEKYGNNLPSPLSKHIDHGIFELRIRQGNNIARVLYFFFLGKRVILTYGFIKKTDKIPKNEIELARKFREDYLKRTKED